MKHALTLALVLLVWAAGCGSDDGGGGPPPPSDSVELDPGTWDFEYSLVSTDEECGGISLGSDTTLVVCDDFDPGDLPTDQIDCTVSVSGSNLVFSCSGTVLIQGCTVTFQGSGSGMVSADKKTVTLQTPIVATFSQDCGALGGVVCNFNIVVIGAWVKRSPCPEPTGTAFTPLQLVHKAIEEAARAQ